MQADDLHRIEGSTRHEPRQSNVDPVCAPVELTHGVRGSGRTVNGSCRKEPIMLRLYTAGTNGSREIVA
jgi:hypothetical protein